MRHRILIVDDQQAILNLFSSVLKDRYAVETAHSAEDALPLVQPEPPFAAVIADVFLPGMNGIALLAQCAKVSPDTVRIALTGDSTRDTVVESVNHANVFRFVSKPVRVDNLVEIVEAAVRRYESLRVERDMMDTTVRTSVNLLLEVLATVDPVTFELSQRVVGAIRAFARTLRLSNAWELELTAALARIGTVSLPTLILRKVAHEIPLTPEESELLAGVPQLGSQLMRPVPRMERVAQAIRYQAKNYDGSGTPADEVAREAIPLPARILRVFTDRARLELRGIVDERARTTMAARKGVYDPALLDACFRVFPHLLLSSVSEDRAVETVDADELEPEAVLGRDIRSNEGLLLVARGTRLTPIIVQRIRTHVALGSITGPFAIQSA